MTDHIKEIQKKLTLEQKALLCSGADSWNTLALKELGVEGIFLSDGPHGLRKEEEKDGVKEIVPATCFPSESCLACSWDRSLAREVGRMAAEECLAHNVSVLLGPGTNIKRSPLCGRNFEYFSEDPFLSSNLAAGFIDGVQSRGVGSVLKHFAANNQETRRMSVSANVGERALREIYLASFEYAVKHSRPWAVMCAYNRINGCYCSQNRKLLTDILRKEWNFDGIVMSDWGAVDQRVDALKAGLDLEMPSSRGIGADKIISAIKSGELPEEVLDTAVERLLSFIEKGMRVKNSKTGFDEQSHHAVAKKAASESMVLLKNENGVLPLKKRGTIAVIGDFAVKPRYQGAGSSHIRPILLDIPLEQMKNSAAGAEILFAPGFSVDTDEYDAQMAAAAVEAAAQADVAVIFAGLPEKFESEGYDRVHMRMPENQNKVISMVAAVQKNTVVVLSNGAPVEMPWLGSVAAVLEGYLGGQAFGGAVADVLFGDVNPSGKLAETFPERLCDTPSFLNFQEDSDLADYSEGIFVGYRYYEKKQIKPLFSFGYGLSYTTFDYISIKTDQDMITDAGEITVTVWVRNTGTRAGKEIVELYVGKAGSKVLRPIKELRGFEKIELIPGEEKCVSFRLEGRAFLYYDAEMNQWAVEDGEYSIRAGTSSANILQECTIRVHSAKSGRRKFTRNSTLEDLLGSETGVKMVRRIMSRYAGIPENDPALLQSREYQSAKHSVLRALLDFMGEGANDETLDAMLEELNRE